jgi:hypothetical protein
LPLTAADQPLELLEDRAVQLVLFFRAWPRVDVREQGVALVRLPAKGEEPLELVGGGTGFEVGGVDRGHRLGECALADGEQERVARGLKP